MTTPRPSATVVLLREANDAPEILFVRRRAGDAFGDSYTFPGGVLDPDEAVARPFCTGIADSDANEILGVDEGALDYFSAVVRELFEETGILLGACGPQPAETRERLLDGSLGWPQVLQQLDVTIPCDELHYFAHWVTPAELPKRWTTRFFLARMPEGQAVCPDESEITDFCWLTAGDALAAAGCGDRQLPYPTLKTVESFLGLATIDAFTDWASERRQRGVPRIQPSLDGERRIIMPENPD